MSEHPPRLQALIDRLSSAVATRPCATTRCKAVERALVEAVQPRQDLLPPALCEAHPEHYARHLVHRDPEGRFSMIAMVWGPGQGTPIHDHGGLWCVECVVQGRIEVRAYAPTAAPCERADLQLECQEVTPAALGEAGHLIPPLDHHVIHNPHEQKAVTLHVYGGDMDWCRVYRPLGAGQGYVAERRQLTMD